MTDKELQRLSRSELLEMLIAQTEENEKLKNRLQQAEALLEDRRIAIGKAGSLAEAALALNGVFQAAEGAAQQYLENVQRMNGQQDEVYREIMEKAEIQAAAIRQEAEAYSQKIRAGADAYWDRIIARSARVLKQPDSLEEMLPPAGEVETE